jgi:hypothetical protein
MAASTRPPPLPPWFGTLVVAGLVGAVAWVVLALGVAAVAPPAPAARGLAEPLLGAALEMHGP